MKVVHRENNLCLRAEVPPRALDQTPPLLLTLGVAGVQEEEEESGFDAVILVGLCEETSQVDLEEKLHEGNLSVRNVKGVDSVMADCLPGVGSEEKELRKFS